MAQVSTQPYDDHAAALLDYVDDPNEATTMAEGSENKILPTSAVDITKPVLTDSPGISDSTELHSSYSHIVTKSSQFPMQHATTELPSKTVTIPTTTIESLQAGISSPKQDTTTSGNVDSPNTVTSSSKPSPGGVTDQPTSSSSSASTSSSTTTLNSSTGSSIKDTTDKMSDLLTSYEPSASESNSATGFSLPTSTSNMQLTSTSALLNASKNVLDSSKDINISVSKSVDYVPSTGDIYSPITASKTVFVVDDSMDVSDVSFKSTSAIPLSPSGKPVNAADTGGTALFGGELTDYILYIGAPVCGLVILIFLIVCVVCLRKRKNKHKGSPTKNHVQDLWVNSQQELPLTTRDPLREVNGGETIGGHRDLVLRRRKNKQRIKIKGKNALELISQTLDNEVNACDDPGITDSNTCTNNDFDFGDLDEDKHVDKVDNVSAIQRDSHKETHINKLGANHSDFHEEIHESKISANYGDFHKERHTDKIGAKHIEGVDDSHEAEPGIDEVEPILDDFDNDFDAALDDLDDILHLEDDFINDNALSEDDIVPVDKGLDGEAEAVLGDLDNILVLEDDFISENALQDHDTDQSGGEDQDQLEGVDRDETDSEEGTITGDEDSDSGHLFDDGLLSGGCTTYEAVFDFQAELETHLTLNQGDVVQVHRKEGNGWWRGTIGENSGWFPSNYVQAAPQDKVENEDEIEMHSETNVSSFMVQPRHTPRHTPIHTPSLRGSTLSEKEIECEPIYCKIQPKEKRKSFPKVCDKSPSKLAADLRENATTPIEDGSKYMAIYSYGGHFTGELTINKGDIIQGKELDRNGWMKGFNETTNTEGWCLLQYVNRLDKEEIQQLDPAVIPNSDSQTSLSPDPLTYKQLEANKNVDKDWVGILHKAVHAFSPDKVGDLEFDIGDLITVFQVLENGWWLGSKGKLVGWFPGQYVEMIPQPSPRLPHNRSAPSPSNSSQTSDSPVSSDETKSITDASSDASPTKNKPRPVRKAPPPPIRLDGSSEHKPSTPVTPKSSDASESKIPTPTMSKVPKVPRPVKVTPPTLPIRDESPNHNPLYEAIGNGRPNHISEPILINTTRHDGLYDLIQHPNNDQNDTPKNKSKPDVPKRYIKPKLVKIPRSEINIPGTGPPNGVPGSANIARPRAPPPPRPVEPPKYPAENTYKVKEAIKTELDNNNEDSFFHLPPQNKFGEIPRKDSSDMDMDVDFIYRGMSSFGSTFGKKEENSFNPEPVMEKDESVFVSQDENLTEKSFQNKLQDIEKALGVQSGYSDNKVEKIDTNQTIYPGIGYESVCESKAINDIPVQSTITEKPTQKKEKPVSRLPPPKQISLSNFENKNFDLDVSVSELSKEEKQTSKMSRIPMSSIPPSKDSCEVTIDTAQDKAINRPDEINTVKSINRHDEKDTVNDSAVIDHTDITPTEHKLDTSSESDQIEGEPSRSRSESFNKPPVAPKPKHKTIPKGLPKPSSGSKIPDGPSDIPDNAINKTDQDSNSIDTITTESEQPTKESQRVSKLPKVAQKSPKMKKSGIPASPLMRMKNSDKQSKPTNKHKLSESDSDVPLSPTSTHANKPESPAMARRGAAKQIVNNEKSIRNRSNSPHGRTGIPTSLKQCSNSPLSKLPRTPNTPSPGTPGTPGTPSPTSIPTANNKSSGLVPPKKIQTPKTQHSPISDHMTPVSANQSPDTSFDMTDDDLDPQATSPKPDRPSKPPRVVKQKSQDGKPPKHGRSLLPVIHKTMDGTNGVTPPTKTKSGIPVSKLPKAASIKTQPEESNNRGPTLFQAVRGYTAQTSEELSFTEGTFVKELSDCDRVGWFVGMLADGSTGLYPAECFKPSPLSNESEA